MVTLRATQTGLQEVTEYVRAVQTRLKRQKPMWDAVGVLMADSIRERLSSGQGSDGVAFQPAVRVRLGFGSETMVDSGKLRDSITHFAHSQGVEWGVPGRLFYAEVLEEGRIISAKNAPALKFHIGTRFFSKKSVEIPARPFVGMSAVDEDSVETLIASYLENG